MTKNFEEKAQEKKNLKPPEFFKKPREMVLAPEINSPDLPATREQEEALSFSHHLSRSPNQTNQTNKPNKQTNQKSTEATRECNLSIKTTMNFQRMGHIQEELPVYICPTVVTLSKTSIITHRVVETTCIAKLVLSFTQHNSPVCMLLPPSLSHLPMQLQQHQLDLIPNGADLPRWETVICIAQHNNASIVFKSPADQYIKLILSNPLANTQPCLIPFIASIW